MDSSLEQNLKLYLALIYLLKPILKLKFTEILVPSNREAPIRCYFYLTFIRYST